MPSRESPAQRVVEGQSQDGRHPCASQVAEERGLFQISLIILGKQIHQSYPFCPTHPQKKSITV